MTKLVEGELRAEGLRFAIVSSRFNEFITSRLVEGALDALRRHGAREEDIAMYKCPGSFELPAVAQKLAPGGRFSAIICLGAVIRGDTPHFDYVANQVTRGIAQVSLETGVPVIMGVLTTDTIEQAIERAGTKAGNRGWDAALSAIELADLYRKIS
jgi:6,7-dimethyl-8-ribityllumazine synthase